MLILIMGYWGKLEEKEKAQKLRKQGLSYKEILMHIHVSKDTISKWCKDIKLTEEQKKRLLEKKTFGQRKGSIIAAENKRKLRQQTIKKIYEKSKKDIGTLSQRDRFMLGIALYSGEGAKADGKSSFANSDPKLVTFMMKWFKDFCSIPPQKFRGSIWLHEGLSENEALNFWSNLTGIPKNQFHKTYIAKVKKDSKKVRKNIHNYGVFSISFYNTEKHRKIMGWISAALNDKIEPVH